MDKNRVLRGNEIYLNKEQLEKYIEKLAIEQTVIKNSHKSTYPINGLKEDFWYITKVYELLNENIKNNITIHPAGEWLLDNYYIIEENVRIILNELTLKKYIHLPGITNEKYKGFSRIYVFANEIVKYTNNQIDRKTVEGALKIYQKNKYITMEEIWILPIFLKISLIQNIKDVCEKIYVSQNQKMKAHKILAETIESSYYNTTMLEESSNKNNLKNYNIKFKSNNSNSLAKQNNLSNKNHVNYPNTPRKQTNPNLQDFQNFEDIQLNKIDQVQTLANIQQEYSFVEHMAYSLRKYGKKGYPYLKALDEIVEKKGITVDQIIKKEHFIIAVSKVSIGNAIMSIKNISRLDFQEIFDSINVVEDILNKDPLKIYAKMTYETKVHYRKEIEKVAKKSGLSEIFIANKVLELAEKNFNKGYKNIEKDKRSHIGYYLIDKGKNALLKELNIKPRELSTEQKKSLYVITFFTITIAITLIIGVIMGQFIKPIYAYLVMLALYLPITEMYLQVLNYILIKKVKPKIIPKINMLNGVDNNNKTFVIIPTIVNSKEKVESLLRKLEVFYLANKTDNLYFAILGDCTTEKEECKKEDKEIIETAKEGVTLLNEKYNKIEGKQDINRFQFIYRKREWSKTEQKYLGWERKRGMIHQFNNYLLTRISKNQISNNSFLLNTLDNEENIPKIKYVITLDGDTELPLNTGLELIGAMAHILNKPIIGNGIVVEGYGIIQPRIGINLNSVKKSRFTEIYAEQAGVDTYTNAISDVYEDNFKEAIYTGKGIYDLEVFDKLLGNTIPDNQVLSHDLLESTYLKCGLASDIYLMDGYPSKYMNYVSRNHRWIRGDWQIINWITPRVTKKNNEVVKNPINRLSKFKIFDNLRRCLASVGVLILLFINYKLTFILGIICILTPLILDMVNYIVFKNETEKQINFSRTIDGIKKSILKGILEIITLPDKVYTSINAVVKTLYRLKTRNNLLEWVTAEEAEALSKTDLKSYYKKMFFSVIAGIFMIIYFTYPRIFLGLLWIFAPYIMWYISKERKALSYKDVITSEEEQFIKNIARKTWLYFKNYMTPENNFLIPDNYQEVLENKDGRIALRTSSTNIGLSLLAVISAYDMKFITKSDAIELLENTLNVIDGLVKWNGHLYNWYDIRTLEPLVPRYVSSVDSGNFVGYLFVVKQFLLQESPQSEAIEKIDLLIKNTNFKVLYNSKINLFSIGFNIEEGKLTDCYYDFLASEARQATFVAIALKQVTSKGWNNLSRTLTVMNGYKGLVSWSGTAFEYLMPNIIMKNYEDSLIDESCKFAIMSSKIYGEKLQIPWGISESAFNLKDLYGNYQYKAFGIPWLGVKRGLADEVVVSPYASVLAITEDVKSVVKNIKDIKELGGTGKYGLYEAIDFTPERLQLQEKYEVVKAYMAHHQALILLSINNLLNNNILKDRFFKNPEIEAIDILLQEKMPRNIVITKSKKERIEKLQYKEYEDFAERTINKLQPFYENTNLISNDEYTIFMTDKGDGFSKYKNIYINRYKKTNDEINGTRFYIKNVNTKKVYSSVLSNISKLPTDYNVLFNDAEDTFERLDGNILTKLRITISPEDNVEIRNLSFKNFGESTETLEINAILEPILSETRADYAHPAFNSMFIEFSKCGDNIIIKRRKALKEDEKVYVAVCLYSENNKFTNYAFEVDKKRIMGRNNNGIPEIIEEELKYIKSNETEISATNSIAKNNGESEKDNISNNIEGSEAKSKIGQENQNTNNNISTENIGINNNIIKLPKTVNPMLLLRKKIEISNTKVQNVTYIMAVGETEEGTLETLEKYKNFEKIKETFELQKAKAEAENRYLTLNSKDILNYQEMLRELLYKSYFKKNCIYTLTKEFESKIYNKEELWKFGISGDYPYILVKISNEYELETLGEVLKAFEYFRLKNVKIDLVIINEEKYSYDDNLRQLIELEIHNKQIVYLLNNGIYVLSNVSNEDLEVLEFRANLIIDAKKGNLDTVIREQKQEYLEYQRYWNTYSNDVEITENPGENIDIPSSDFLKNLKYTNGYGGFTQDGKEYHIAINKNAKLPTVWSNILTNERFGTLVTETSGGYTWNRNSRLNKITAWNNNAVTDIPSEIIYVKNTETNDYWTIGYSVAPKNIEYDIIYGFGYALYKQIYDDILQENQIFVPVNDSVKINYINLRNLSNKVKTLKLFYYIKPVLGEDEVDSNSSIFTNLDIENNILSFKNLRNSQETAYISSSEKIVAYTGSKKSFVGCGNIYYPEALYRNTNIILDNQNSIYEESAIVLEINIELKEYENKEIVLILGEETTYNDLVKNKGKYVDIENVKVELDNVKAYWNNKVNKLQIKTPDEEMNTMLNGWNVYQTLASRLYGRTGYYQSSGAIGYRDQLQDTIGIKYIDETLLKKQIIKIAEHQFSEGDVLHWWHEDTNKGIRTRFSDDLLWLPYAIIEYIDYTGDYGILKEKVPYLKGEVLPQGCDERYDLYLPGNKKGTVLEHSIRALQKGINVGRNGFIKIGTGDWNDGFSTVGNKGVGESVWVTFFVYYILSKVINYSEDIVSVEFYKGIIDNKTCISLAKFNVKLIFEINKSLNKTMDNSSNEVLANKKNINLNSKLINSSNKNLSVGLRKLKSQSKLEINDNSGEQNSNNNGGSISYTLNSKTYEIQISLSYKLIVELMKNFRNCINEKAWDGEWFNRAYNDDGKIIGTSKGEECIIDCIAQSWSIISNSADKEKQRIAFESVEKYLVDKENKMVKLLTPSFDRSDLNPGYIRAYTNGVRENGGQYTHGSLWLVWAATMLGYKEKVHELYKMFIPINHSLDKDEADKYMVEPYVIVADIYGEENLIGRGGWTWYTGASAWFYKIGIEYILGMKIKEGRLSIKPCVPENWNEYKIRYVYGSAVYNIVVKRKKEKGFFLNGIEIPNGEIKLIDNGRINDVEVHFL